VISFHRLRAVRSEAGKRSVPENDMPPPSRAGVEAAFHLSKGELIFRAALSRFLLGTVAVIVLPLLYPSARPFLWVYAAYIGFAAVEQILIRKHIGGGVRSLVAGLVDLAVLTFTVHRLGSVATVMASLYFIAGVLNALVIGLRVGVILAALNALAYAGVVCAEQVGLLPYAPDVPELAQLGVPSATLAGLSMILVTVLLVTSTATVGFLVRAVRQREDALVRANEQLVVLSERDPLTNLYNRRRLFERLELELERVRRGHPLSLIMLDLDRFKRVNDSQGHMRGDLLLKEIAGALAENTRATDVVGRYGGDEFMIVLGDTDETQARIVAERVAASVKDIGEHFAGDTPPVTASIGLAFAREDDMVASLLRRADENAYRAKQAGGDRVAV